MAVMRILSRSTLRNFWESHPDAEEVLKTWYYEASHADWQSPVDLKSAHGSASIIANNRVVFNIKGNTAVFPRMRYSAKPGNPSKSSIRQIKLYSVAVMGRN